MGIPPQAENTISNKYNKVQTSVPVHFARLVPNNYDTPMGLVKADFELTLYQLISGFGRAWLCCKYPPQKCPILIKLKDDAWNVAL